MELDDELNPEDREVVVSLLAQYYDVFSNKPGVACVAPHHIQLTSKEPVRVKHDQIPLRLMDAVIAEIREMVAAGIIDRSNFYANPIAGVKKKEDGVRVCCDCRRVNAVTQTDVKPMPDSQAIFATLVN